MTPLARGLVALIERYQRVGGGPALFGVECNFEPSCSAYMREAIERHGVLAGLRLGIARLCRCTERDAVQKTHDPVPARR